MWATGEPREMTQTQISENEEQKPNKKHQIWNHALFKHKVTEKLSVLQVQNELPVSPKHTVRDVII